MAKIARKTQLVFGSQAGANQIGVFGSFAAGTPAYSTDPAVLQSLSNYLAGWFSGVAGDNSPAIEDMNALCYLFAYQLAYHMQSGIPEWDAGTTYYQGSLALDPGGSGTIYYSLSNTNTGNVLSNRTYWGVQSVPTGVPITATTNTTIAAGTGVFRSNSTSGNLTHTLPAISTLPIGVQIVIKDVGTAGFATSLKGSGTDTIDGTVTYSQTLNKYRSVTVFNNGTSWDVI